LFHGIPPGVVTANVREIMRSGIRVASSAQWKEGNRQKELCQEQPTAQCFLTDHVPCAIIPPRDIPTTWMLRCPVQPIESKRTTTSSAIPLVLAKRERQRHCAGGGGGKDVRRMQRTYMAPWVFRCCPYLYCRTRRPSTLRDSQSNRPDPSTRTCCCSVCSARGWIVRRSLFPRTSEAEPTQRTP
jgi:hypothetical protein